MSVNILGNRNPGVKRKTGDIQDSKSQGETEVSLGGGVGGVVRDSFVH
jgi:hypothetical protein